MYYHITSQSIVISNDYALFIKMALYIPRYVADAVDALVYVFLYPPVRRYAKGKLQKLSKRRTNHVSCTNGVRVWKRSVPFGAVIK